MSTLVLPRFLFCFFRNFTLCVGKGVQLRVISANCCRKWLWGNSSYQSRLQSSSRAWNRPCSSPRTLVSVFMTLCHFQLKCHICVFSSSFCAPNLWWGLGFTWEKIPFLMPGWDLQNLVPSGYYCYYYYYYLLLNIFIIYLFTIKYYYYYYLLLILFFIMYFIFIYMCL